MFENLFISTLASSTNVKNYSGTFLEHSIKFHNQMDDEKSMAPKTGGIIMALQKH